jgi:hypothetical protein
MEAMIILARQITRIMTTATIGIGIEGSGGIRGLGRTKPWQGLCC